jgi:hypothetical protein
LVAWEPSSLVVGVANCCNLLQSVAGARRQPNTVADCFRRLQSVAICYKTQECVNLMSQHGRAIPFLYEGAIRQHQTWAAIQKENGESTNSEFGAKLATADNAPKG